MRKGPREAGAVGRPSFLVNGDHYAGCLDDRGRSLAFRQSERRSRSFRDDGNNFDARCDFQTNLAVNGSLNKLGHFSFQNVACANLHSGPNCFKRFAAQQSLSLLSDLCTSLSSLPEAPVPVPVPGQGPV
jgi:hypothetical protein